MTYKQGMADVSTLQNWAGLHEFRPSTISHPATEAELCDAVGAGAAAHGRVKAIGSAHTNTDLADTAGTLVVLDRYTGVVAADRSSSTVEVRAGTPLHQLNDELAALGLALPALGDIDRQTVSGATSTGTHGTGRSVRTISAQIVSARLITADGAPLAIGPDDPRLPAVRVGLGALGVLSTVTVRCVPAFMLHAIDGPARLDDALAAFGGAVAANDHAEMYWMPGTDWALMRASAHEPNAWRPPDPGPIDAIDDTSQFILGLLGHWQPEHGAVHRWSDRSDRVFCSERDTKFVEMEYAVPRDALMQAFDVVRTHCAEHGPLGMPVEIRVTVADDSWLSMGSGRDTAFIAIHDWPKAAWSEPFQAIERQFQALGGRPHWGKMHWRTSADLAPAYPRWADFAAVRDALDPRRVFANAHLDRVLDS
jgi:L-gulono-1,4-lactone dehydrogenase